LITGISSGFCESIAKLCLERGDTVYAFGRHNNKLFINHAGYFFLHVDLGDIGMLRENIKTFVKKHHFDLVILNAGMLGDIKELGETSLDEIHGIMDLNVWANKHIIDTLDLHAEVDQLIAISSGAAVNSHKGWGAYAISKAALNTMIKIYAEEKPWTHFSSIDLGIVMTPDLKAVLEKADAEIYPSVSHIKEGTVLTPQYAAKRFLSACESALKKKSGSILSAGTSVAASGEHP